MATHTIYSTDIQQTQQTSYKLVNFMIRMEEKLLIELFNMTCSLDCNVTVGKNKIKKKQIATLILVTKQPQTKSHFSPTS